jgi:Ca-activated chloride channel family protein
MGDPESTGAGRIDQESMEAVAHATGGSAFLALDRAELAGIYDEIDELTPEEIETITYRPTTPLFHWPMGAAVGLVLLYHFGMSVGAGVRRLGVGNA